MSYSQNNEEEIILEYFKDKPKGLLIDIGANDGKTFSNSLALIEKGWEAVLYEPNPFAFKKLQGLHKENNNVSYWNFAIGTEHCLMAMQCNEPHIEGDTGLLSTLKPEEIKRWEGLKFTEEIVEVRPLILNEGLSVDFITIDAEGMDFDILQQIDLNKHAVQLLCIEHNSNETEVERMTKYANSFGLHTIAINAENIIFGR